MLQSDLEHVYNFSDKQLGDLLLENAGITETQRTLILASIGNSKEFHKVKDALLEQHNKIHLQKTSDQVSRDQRQGLRRDRKRFSRGNRLSGQQMLE